MAEALINHEIKCGVKAYSSGVKASGIVNPNALKVLQNAGINTQGLRSKLLESVMDIEYDLVVTVCDNAKESCPVFPKKSNILHVGFEDPDGKEFGVFEETFKEIKERLLPVIEKELC